MTTKRGVRLLSAGHCSVCLPETPIAFLTGVSNGRVFAYEVVVHAIFGAVLGALLSEAD